MIKKNDSAGLVLHVRLPVSIYNALKRYSVNHQRPLSQAAKVLIVNQLVAEKQLTLEEAFPTGAKNEH